MASRLEVLARQLTLESPAGGGSTDFSGLCPRGLAKYLTHDNSELRQEIYEFLKVRARGGGAAAGPHAARGAR
jgi:hypothetical protein